ncbi:MAG: hypothetical protein GY716_03110 [bacterium]|nr:hypothetical protein [bacterium]
MSMESDSATVVCTTRKIRVDVPLLVSLSTNVLTVREFTVNLSIGGMFIPTELEIEVDSIATLKFHVGQFEEPFTIRARVVHSVTPEDATAERPAGIGVELLDLDDEGRDTLESIVEGGKACSIVESIRRSARGNGVTLLQILRTRPVGQKVMLARIANSVEIDALIRDGNASVIERLLDSPRLNPNQVATILRNRTLPSKVVGLVRNEPRWLDHDEAVYLFCSHPRALLQDVKEELTRLTPPRLQQLARDMNINPQIRAAAKQAAAKRGIRIA